MIYNKKNLLEAKIISAVKKLTQKKSRRLHDPIFKGNEKKYLENCINSGYVSYVGKYVNTFEKKLSNYTNSKYSVAISSGTSALHLVLKYFNVGSNDEVIIPSLTYVATANAVKYCNANPNFVDIEKETLGICPEKLEIYLKKTTKKIGKHIYNLKTRKKIKALIVVHLYGFPSKISQLKKICKKNNIILIEDAAEAVGSFLKGKHLGTFANAGILSFNGNKTITTGGGGAILVNSKKAAIKLRHLSVHSKKPGSDHEHSEVGYNYRMTNLSAAVGCAQLENLRKILIAKRKNFSFYQNRFKNIKDIKVISEPRNSKCNYWLIILLFKNKKIKNRILKKYRKKGHGFRSTWKPLHKLKMFKNCPRDKIINSNFFYDFSISLPSSPVLNFKRFA